MLKMAPVTVNYHNSTNGWAWGTMSNNYALDDSPVINTGLSVVHSLVMTPQSTTGVALSSAILTALPSGSPEVEIELITEGGVKINSGTSVVYWIATGVQ